MPERKVIIGSSQGMHARTAEIFVRAAQRQPVSVTLGTGDRGPVSAGSILGVLSLGVGHGAEVTLRAEGEQAPQALAELGDLLARDLDAEESG